MQSRELRVAGIAAFVLLAGSLVALAGAPQAQEPVGVDAAGSAGATVSTSGSGQASAEPDLAVIHATSVARADDPATATDRLARNVSALRNALDEENVSDDQIRTTNYDLSDASERRGPGLPPNETSYRAQQTLAIEVTDVERVGAIVDVAVANGATGIRGVQFRLSEERERDLRTRALERAMTDARTRATTLASSEGLQITGVQAIEAGGSPGRPVLEADASAGAGTTIDPGPVSVDATVQVTYNATDGM